MISPSLAPILNWEDVPPCEPCAFRYSNDAHRDASARLILALYGARVCQEDPTQDDGLYRPQNLARRAITAWECRMAAAKYDGHRTADERAVCAGNLAAYYDHFEEWEADIGVPDAPLHFIAELENPMRGVPHYDIAAARSRADAEVMK